MTQTQTLIPNLGLEEKISKGAANALIQIFADEMALTLKTHNFGFNVIGPRFQQTHALLGLQREKLECLTNATALQIRQLGFRVPTIIEVMKTAQIAPQKADFVDEDSMMKVLLQDHEAFIVFLARERERVANLPELVIEDFLLDQLKAHRILAWGLRAHLEKLEGNMSFAVPSGMVSQHTQPIGTQQGMGTQMGQPSMTGTQYGTQKPSFREQQGMGTQMGQPSVTGTQHGSSGMGQSSTSGVGQTGMGQSGMEGVQGYGREQQTWGQPTGMGQSSTGMGQSPSTGMGQSSSGMSQPPKKY